MASSLYILHAVDDKVEKERVEKKKEK